MSLVVSALGAEPTLTEYASSPEWQINGVAVTAADRKFVSMPRWTDESTPSVGEILPGGRIVPYPGSSWNFWSPGADPAKAFVSVNAVWVDGAGMLWAVDNGRPKFGELVPGAPKLVQIDPARDAVVRSYPFDATIAPAGSYMNDVRVRDGWAYLSESGLGAFVVVELATGKTARILAGHPATQADAEVIPQVAGHEFRNAKGEVPRLHLNDIMLSPDGQWLYFQPTSGPLLRRIPTAALRAAVLENRDPAATIETVGPTRNAGGMEMAADGSIYLSDLERSALWRRSPEGNWSELLRDERLIWPDAMGFGPDGSIYIPAAQVHRLPPFSRSGKSELERPFRVYRYRSDKK